MDAQTLLRQQWQQMLQSRSIDPDKNDQLFANLIRAYNKRSRNYHNPEHLADMFRHFERHWPHLSNPDLVAAAIFFHDVIYNPARRDNEVKSAEYAAKKLPILGFSPEETRIVCDYILATQKHELPENARPDLAWLLDFDLAILGSDWKTYQEYTQKIRREYQVYPDILYKPGRRKAMEHFLRRATIFHTATFRELFEIQARSNIKREIDFSAKNQ